MHFYKLMFILMMLLYICKNGPGVKRCIVCEAHHPAGGDQEYCVICEVGSDGTIVEYVLPVHYLVVGQYKYIMYTCENTPDGE